MNRAVPRDFSYVRSASSGTSIPAEPADNVASENVCPIFRSDSLSPEDDIWRGLLLHHDPGFAAPLPLGPRVHYMVIIYNASYHRSRNCLPQYCDIRATGRTFIRWRTMVLLVPSKNGLVQECTMQITYLLFDSLPPSMLLTLPY